MQVGLHPPLWPSSTFPLVLQNFAVPRTLHYSLLFRFRGLADRAPCLLGIFSRVVVGVGVAAILVDDVLLFRCTGGPVAGLQVVLVRGVG